MSGEDSLQPTELEQNIVMDVGFAEPDAPAPSDDHEHDETPEPKHSLTGTGDGSTALTKEAIERAQLTGEGPLAGSASGNAQRNGNRKGSKRSPAESANSDIALASYGALLDQVRKSAQKTLQAEKKKLADMRSNYAMMNSLINQLQAKLDEWHQNHQEIADNVHEVNEDVYAKTVQDTGTAIDMSTRIKIDHADYVERVRMLETDQQEAIRRILTPEENKDGNEEDHRPYFQLDTAKYLSSIGYAAESMIQQKEGNDLGSGYVFKRGDEYYTFTVSSSNEGPGTPLTYSVSKEPVKVTDPEQIAEIKYAESHGAARFVDEKTAHLIVTSVSDLEQEFADEFAQKQYDRIQKERRQQKPDEAIAQLKTKITALKEQSAELEEEIKALARQLGMEFDPDNLDMNSIEQQLNKRREETKNLVRQIEKQEILVNHQSAMNEYLESDKFEALFKSKMRSTGEITINIEKDIMTIQGISDPEFIAKSVAFMESQGFKIEEGSIPPEIEEKLLEARKEIDKLIEEAKAKTQPKAKTGDVASSVDSSPALASAPKIGESFAAVSGAAGSDVIQPAYERDTGVQVIPAGR